MIQVLRCSGPGEGTEVLGGTTVDVETHRNNEMHLGFTHILGWDVCGSSSGDPQTEESLAASDPTAVMSSSPPCGGRLHSIAPPIGGGGDQNRKYNRKH